MKERWVALGALLMIVCSSGLPGRQASAQDFARGEQLFRLCGQCHGPNAEGNETFGGPALAGMDQWYIEEQLRKFQAGLRGASPDDVMGLRMGPMSRMLDREGDIEAVSAFLAGLPRAELQKTVSGGNPEAGKVFYATCAACHGAKAEGSRELNGPPLSHQADWYLIGQLEKFKAGVRGGNPQNVNAVMMRPMAFTLPDEQALKDVVAYIETLSE